MTIIIAIVAAILMGTVLGLLGGGGSILAVPILHYILEVPSKEAIATSLLIVGATSLVAVVNHGRQGNVMWRIGLIFGGFAMAGAYVGGLLAQFIPGPVLLGFFALLMLVTAVMMLRGKSSIEPDPESKKKLPILKIGLEGFVVGGVTGLVGAGGGFLVVPALVLLGGLPMKKAIGTSLFVIALKSGAGFAGYAGHVSVDWSLVLPFLGAALVGAFIGERLSRGIDASKLRTGFAYFVLMMGAGIIYTELPFTMPIWLTAIFAVLFIVAMGLFDRFVRAPREAEA